MELVRYHTQHYLPIPLLPPGYPTYPSVPLYIGMVVLEGMVLGVQG